MAMSREEISAHAGGAVLVNGSGDLAMSVEHRALIGQKCKLVKLTKGGMVLVEFNGQQLIVKPGQISAA